MTLLSSKHTQSSALIMSEYFQGDFQKVPLLHACKCKHVEIRGLNDSVIAKGTVCFRGPALWFSKIAYRQKDPFNQYRRSFHLIFDETSTFSSRFFFFFKIFVLVRVIPFSTIMTYFYKNTACAFSLLCCFPTQLCRCQCFIYDTCLSQ